MARIICCGNIAYDLIATREDKKGGYTFEARPGGSIFNTARLLARLGLDVSFLAKSGDDFLGHSLLSVMEREKISTKFVSVDGRIKTGLAFAKIDKSGNSSYLFYRSSSPHASPKVKDIPAGIFKSAVVFHTGSGFSYADHSFKTTLDLMIRARQKKVFTTYDPNWREKRVKDKKKARLRIERLIRHSDLLKLSDTDVLGITGEKTLSSALRHLPPRTIVTLGDKGSFFWDGRKRMYSPAVKTRVVDTIGAGDAFTAGLIYRYCLLGAERFWEEMPADLSFASAAAAIVCSSRGATGSLKNARSVKSLLR
jgi:fructokinase